MIGRHENRRRAAAKALIALSAVLVSIIACVPVNNSVRETVNTPNDAYVSEGIQEAASALQPGMESFPASGIGELQGFRPGLEPEPEPEIEPEPEPEPQIASLPVHIRIPKLSVDADIQGTSEDETETMEIAPSASIISWLQDGPIPGNQGNAILAGHNRWKGVQGQLFYLDTLEIGDDMEIDYADGTSLTFRMESVFVYLLATADADSIMDLEGEARVTVITCKDPFNPKTGTSDNRIIAVFKEESVFIVPDPPIKPWAPIDPDVIEADAGQSLLDQSESPVKD